MADYFEITRGRAHWHDIAINCVGIFQWRAGSEVRQLLSGVWHPRDSEQVALLANAVARRGFQFRRIYDRSFPRVG